MPQRVVFSQTVLNKLQEEARLYQRLLLNQTIEIVYHDPLADITTSVAINFEKGNFAHLAGIKTLGNNVSAKELFDKCLQNRLQPGNARFTHNETYFEMKADVFSRIANLDATAKTLGDYDNGSAISLNADKIVGETPAGLAILEVNGSYVPTSVLNYDIRNVIQEDTYTKVLATLKYPTGLRQNAQIEIPNNDLTPEETGQLNDFLINNGYAHEAIHAEQVGNARQPDGGAYGDVVYPGETERKRNTDSPYEGMVFEYHDVDHEGATYDTADSLSGTYRVTDLSQYPQRVGVEPIDVPNSPGTTGILNWDKQVETGEIESRYQQPNRPNMHIRDLPEELQDKISFSLSQAGVGWAGLNRAMNTRLCDLEGIIDMETIATEVIKPLEISTKLLLGEEFYNKETGEWVYFDPDFDGPAPSSLDSLTDTTVGTTYVAPKHYVESANLMDHYNPALDKNASLLDKANKIATNGGDWVTVEEATQSTLESLLGNPTARAEEYNRKLNQGTRNKGLKI